MRLFTEEGLLFLAYLTGYNLELITQLLGFEDFENLYRDVFKTKLFQLSDYELDRNITDARAEAAAAIQRHRFHGIKYVLADQHLYPKALNRIKHQPPIIFYRGELRPEPMVAIVGTRNTSRYARERTTDVTRKFIHAGYGIASGLALGIDTMAHCCALENRAYTVAVMPHSLDAIYPKENYGLACDILDAGGVLVSELPIGINRGKQSFVARNRIQSGMSDVVIPIEMASQSGTMHTVRFAKSQGKKLLLIRPPDNGQSLPQYEGLVKLINEEAEKQTPNVIVVNEDFRVGDHFRDESAPASQMTLF